ncbi:MAG: precorrin-6y C5,15-methyltransferase (decarboxylating) subunit CbiE [Elusimicrobia bacterium]|nr:precorrin-6y C5,15-methyltransferase (decarboxylating) subunit CbiE [Elusimicrobiota bacterium]
MNEAKVHVIGIGDDGPRGLSAAALARIEQAEVVFGGERHLSFFPALTAEKVPVKSNLKEVAARIKLELGKKRLAVLASGDPLFYGIAKYLMTQVPKRHFEILPAVSSVQLAFARAKESWEDAAVVSLHGRPIDEILEAARQAKKIGILTDERNTPARIAGFLMENGLGGFAATVCENLGGDDEQVSQWDLPELVRKEFAALNVLVLVKKPYEPAPGGIGKWHLGLPESEFFQRMPEKGLITKSEVRVLSLTKLKLEARSVVWDIGAGSGSVSIEAALLAKEGKVYAVEKNAEDHRLILMNIEKFMVRNVRAVHALAPDCLEAIGDDPDAVFIGGSSGSMGTLIDLCARRLRPGGRMVLNVATIENLFEASQAIKKLCWRGDATLVSVARSQPVLELTRFAALNPVYILSAEKPAHGGAE